MLGTESDSDQAGGQSPQKREPAQGTDEEGRLEVAGGIEDALDEAVLDQHLEPLCLACRRLAAILQAERGAVVVGQRTPGHTQLVTQSSLPEGSVLQLVVGGMLLTDGTRLEGRGVIPDIERDDDWMVQPAQEDAWVLAAVRELRRSSEASGSPERTP